MIVNKISDLSSIDNSELLKKDSFVKAIKNTDILIAPHHGRESGYCAELFEHFSPNLTIISDGSYCDTSATSRYSSITNGWKVNYRNGKSETRKCLSTRKDGYIVIKLGYNTGNKPFMEVKAKCN